MDIVMKRNAVTGHERPQEKDFNEAKRVVRVVPRTPEIRKYLKHPATRVGFLTEGSSEWPNDQFTRRRLMEGVISIEPAKSKPKEAEGESEQATQQASAEAPRQSSSAKPARTVPDSTAPETSGDSSKTTAPR
jgi:hypothetical protein